MMILFYVLWALVYPTMQASTSIELKNSTAELVTGNGKSNLKSVNPKEPCSCIPYYECMDLDLRKNADICEHFMKVCCANRTTALSIINRVKRHNQGCGHRHVNGVGFQITSNNAKEAKYGEFPWVVGIVNDSRIITCGGALIHPKVVLTAAHCVVDNNPSKVRIGEWDTSTNFEIYPHEERNIQNVTIYPNFTKKHLLHDIALIHLDSPVKIENHIGTICLPPSDISLISPTCTVTGWGNNVYGQNSGHEDILRSVDLPLVSNDVCQNQLKSLKFDESSILHYSVCAGGKKIDPCTGDKGGPLICPVPGNSDNRYYQLGIVSGGVGCEAENVPGLYTNLTHYRKWIDNEMKKMGLDDSSYTY